MNNVIKNLLALKVVELASSDIDNSYAIHDGLNVINYSPFELIKKTMEEGISPTIIINSGSGPSFLISQVFQENQQKEIIDYFMSLIDREEVAKFKENDLQQIYDCLSHIPDKRTEILEKFFQLGFDFTQGAFDEVGKALGSDIDFFELCLKYKPNFKLDFIYENEHGTEGFYIDEILQDDVISLKVMQKNGVGQLLTNDIEEKENLIDFLRTIREREEFKNKLEGQLAEKASAPRRKI